MNPDASIAQRSATTGNLLISMPKASSNARVNVQKCNSSPLFYTSQAEEQGKEKSGAWSKVNAVKNMERANALMEQPPVKKVSSNFLLLMMLEHKMFLHGVVYSIFLLQMVMILASCRNWCHQKYSTKNLR